MLASRKKRVILTIIVLLLALLALFLSIGGRVLVISDDIAKDRPTDMVLLMGSLPDRTLGAYELASNMSDYHIYIVKSDMPGVELLQSRGVVMPNYADLAAQALLDLGIPQQNITVIDGAAASTRDEALILHQYLADKLTNRQLVVVTSKYHSRRAGWIFKSAFKDARRYRARCIRMDKDD